jgi:CBS domain-containing protein
VICPSCGYDNIAGADACSACLNSLTLEDIPPDEARNRVERSLMEDRVADLHPAAPVSVREGARLDEAVATMRAERLGCVLVTDASDKLVGILTERDLLNKVAIEVEDLSRAVVSDFMTPRPETIEPNRPLAYALQRMMVGDLRHLPLVDPNGCAVGIISSRDVVRRIAALVGVIKG